MLLISAKDMKHVDLTQLKAALKVKLENDLSSALALLEFENSEREHFRLFSHFIFACRVNFMTFKNRKSLYLSHISSFLWFSKMLKSS